ncbi:MAG: phage tail sheath subtilisin-like domain-containing protein [Pseudomonadota bacterium]
MSAAVPFSNIPNDLRVPLFYAEMDSSRANTASNGQPMLLIGSKLSTAPVAVDTPVLVGGIDLAMQQVGRGSMLAAMIARARAIDPFGELWYIAVPDIAAGTAATGTITVTGPATTAGVITLYIAGRRLQVAVAAADTATIVAAAIVAAITADTDMPVSAANAAGVVTLTCRWKGLTGNDLVVIENYRGALGGESTPTGLALAIVAFSGGAGTPTLTATIPAMGDEPYDFIAQPFSDATTLATFSTEMGDTAGRWSWLRQVYGHIYSGLRGTLASLSAFGVTRNDQHATVWGYENDCPMPVWEQAAAYAARNAVFLRIDPARPTQTGSLDGLLVPRAGKRFGNTDRQTLLSKGIATAYSAVGVLYVERAITTYQKNVYGQADNSYLDSETLHTSAYVLRFLRNRVVSKYGRCKLANDGTRYDGDGIVTPKTIRAELISAYGELERAGIVENSALFAKYLIVERDADSNRVNVLFPPDYVNQLRVFAVLNQFRTQYPANA